MSAFTHSQYNKMAVDFGTSNTVVTFWNEETADVDLYEIPDVTLPFTFVEDGREITIPYVPSMIHYQNSRTSFVGFQVIEKMLEKSKGSFRWIKAYIQARRNMKQTLSDGTSVDYYQAGRDFLERILMFASESARVDIGSCEVAFTVPVESFEHYTDWLSETCIKLGVRRYRFIDESTSCIFGYDTHLQPHDIFLIFDFGGGTLDISIVRMEERIEQGLGCRVVGKAGCRIGGRTIDGWLYSDMLKRARIHDVDARAASALFMLNVEKIKEKLSHEKRVDYDIYHKDSGLCLKGSYHRTDFEDLLEERGLYNTIQQTIERALKQAAESGITKEDIKEALLVGGTSQIPSVRRQMRMHFGDRTRFYRPYDAVARGACRFLSSDVEALYDHIQHDYAIKSYRKGRYEFIPLIPRGTKYPTKPDFKRVTMKAVRNGQRFFGINIYEVAQKGSNPSVGTGELIFDANGFAVFDRNHSVSVGESTEFWMNEDNPTFIEADPPAERGVARFSVSFRVDTQKRLLVTVRDLVTQRLLYEDYPVVKLK